MKCRLCFLFFVLCVLNGFAQRNDNIWIFGYHVPPYTLAPGLDFFFGSPDTIGVDAPFNYISTADASMCDDNGTLLFYTNGIEIANWNNQIIQNSSGFNTDSTGNASSRWQGVIALPFPDHPGQYILFHLCGIYFGSWPYSLKLYYSVVDMNQNGGLGTMLSLNQVIFNDTLLPATMQATRHGNGRDWWVITKKAYSGGFHLTLLTPNGIQRDTVIFPGPYVTVFNQGQGQANFSPDGSLYAMTYNTENKLLLYDFNRCSGELAFRDSVHFTPNDPYEWPVWGCSFSPNSQYLYATTNNDLYQYDVLTGLAGSQTHIADFDGFTDPHPNLFFRHALGPDGKIYLTSWGSTRFMHVINNPDDPDSLCNFVQHQLQLSGLQGSTLPDFPNYRLGALAGSSCDTLLTSSPHIAHRHAPEIVPNPNNGCFSIRYLLDFSKGGYLTIINELNQVVLEKRIPHWSVLQNIRAPELHSGVYILRMETANEVFYSRFIKN